MNAETRAAWRAHRRAMGLCVDCREKARPGRSYCEKHAERNRLLTEQKRIQRRKSGRCVACGDMAMPGKSRCRLCNIAHNETCRLRKVRLTENGLCPRCGSREPTDGKTYCTRCLRLYCRANRTKYHKRVIAKKRILEWRRVWAGNPDYVAKRFEQLMRGYKTTGEVRAMG